jgi:hypothetical protein
MKLPSRLFNGKNDQREEAIAAWEEATRLSYEYEGALRAGKPLDCPEYHRFREAAIRARELTEQILRGEET